MEELLERFLKNIAIEDIAPYEECHLVKCKFDKENSILKVELLFPTIPSYSLIENLFQKLEKAKYQTNISFRYTQERDEERLVALLKDQFYAVTQIKENVFPKYEYDKTNNEFVFIFQSRLEEDSFRSVLGSWQTLLEELNLKTSISSKRIYETELEKRDKEMQEVLKNIRFVFDQYIEKNEGYTRRIRGNYVPVALKDVTEKSGNISFIGKVFYVEEKTSRKDGKTILNLYVYDKTTSIEVIAYEDYRSLRKEQLEKFKKIGSILKIRGYPRISKFSHALQIKADYIDFSSEPFDPIYEDSSEQKRVELHLHSKMSNMDGVTTITDYVNQAKKWGMEAIAITDHGVVQAYPEAQKAAEAANIKMIYGVEMYMIEDQLEYILNPSDQQLNKASYCVFDLETTGLSARYDKIIEFGAVKVVGGLVVDAIDFFIDPEMELSAFTTRLTHITTEMVKGKTKIREAMKRIKEFIGDSILVAHNATFDYGFLIEACHKLNEEEIKNPVIDTLALSRYIFPNNKSHTLGAVSRLLEINYDESVAHRANYDANVLNSVWQAMLAKITAENHLMKHEDLAYLFSQDTFKNQRPKHVTVYAKNAQGLKDLFRLISKSHIEYFANGPRIPRSEIEKVRENLLIGSACFNGEIFDTAMTRGKNILQNRMKFYDFIEIQPLDNYIFLVHDGQINTINDIIKIIKDIIDAADEIGKKVVATGDAHYLHPEDKIFRDVYIFAKSVGGGRHPLNPYSRKEKKYENPNQHFRSTSEMLQCFYFLPEEKVKEIVIENSVEIAKQIEDLKPIKNQLYPPKIENCDQRLMDRVYEKAHRLYGDPLPKLIEDRLKAELDGIIKYGYSVQFFIASEIVRKANEDGFIVGSRGSVGSSFVATMADITEVNPLPPHYLCPNCKHIEFIEDESVKSGYDLPDKKCEHCGCEMIHDGQNLPFATFLGFRAEKVPDIDLNFSGDYQARAHDLTKVLLGAKNVYRAGTIETVAEKTAYGYVLGYYEEKGIDPDTISHAEKTRLAVGCQDVKRTTGQHPGGIIVIPDQYDVHDFTPIQYPADDQNATWKTTHFDFHAIHDNVLKLDLLGHVDPTALKMLGDLSNIKPQDVPMNDKKVISIFNSRDALGCKENYLKETTGALGLPEFGTMLTRQMLEEIRPTTFADLVRISGLSHGTDVWAGNAQDLLKNKICDVDGIIACRDDVMLFLQAHGIDNSIAFQIMESVRKGKKVPEKYLDILKEHHIPEYYIESADKCKYLFPKAHAIAYVTMAVRIAWYKVYQPLAYYAVYFSTRSKQFDIRAMMEGKQAIIARIEQIRELREKHMQSPKDDEIEKTLIIALEMAERGYEFGTLDLYKSEAKTFLIDKNAQKIIPPFIVIDGLGDNAALSVIEARKHPFYSQQDLLERTKLNSQNVEQLKKLGVLGDLPENDQLTLF